MASKAQIFQTLLSGVRSSGITLSGGKVYFYAAGTLTLKDVYEDRNKAVTAANPFTLGSNGTAEIFGDGLYDVKVTDADGSQKYYWDGVSLVDILSAGVERQNSDFADLNAAIASIGSTPTTLNISTADFAMTGNATVPATLTLKMTYPGSIDQGAHTLTINSPFTAGSYQVFSGSGSVAGLKEARPEWWQENTTPGTTDMAAAIRLAIASSAKRIKLQATSYRVDSTVILSTQSGRDLSFVGEGRDATAFLTSINDGTPVFKIAGQWHDVSNFKINSYNGSQLNFIGIQAGDAAAGTSFTRSKLRIKVSNAAVGVAVRGWINDIDVLTNMSDLGFYGREINSCIVSLRTENCLKSFDIVTCYGTTFSQILDENTFTTETTVTSVIDDFRGVNIDSIYLEGGTYSDTVISFAPTVQSYDLTISALRSVVGPTNRAQVVLIDMVDTGYVSGNIAIGGYYAGLGTTANSKGIVRRDLNYPATPDSNNSGMRVQDLSKRLRPVRNYFGDSRLDHGFNTFDAVNKTNTTTSIETGNTYLGRAGIRITASAGASQQAASFSRRVANFPYVSNLVGRTLKAYAWVFVPDLPFFADRTYRPAFDFGVSGSASSYTPPQRPMLAGQWNLVETPDLAIPVGWLGTGTDRIVFEFFVNNTSNVISDSGYYIIIGGIFLCDSDAHITDIASGNYIDDNLLGISSDGTNMKIKSNTYTGLILADSSVAVGDVIETFPPTSGGKIGRVCTTAGDVGGTAVFKTYGAID